MPPAESTLMCPQCAAALTPVRLACSSCGITVEGPFQFNEFATLAPEDLHFLRIFVRSEGRIRDMETALGLSYPTIRTRLTALKTKLEAAQLTERPASTSPDEAIQGVLRSLKSGTLTFDDALGAIQRIQAARATHPV